MGLLDRVLLRNDAVKAVIKQEVTQQTSKFEKTMLDSFKAMIKPPYRYVYPKSEMELKDFFQGWALACIERIATDFATVSNYIEDDGKPVLDHELNRILCEPNYEQTAFGFKYELLKWLMFNGNAYIYVEPLRFSKKPGSMWILPSDKVSIITNMDTSNPELIGYFRLIRPMGVIDIPPSYIVHIKTVNPATLFEKNVYIGTSSYVEGLKDSIEADREAPEFLKKYSKRQAIQPFVIQFPKDYNPGPADIATIKAGWNDDNPDFPMAGIIPDGGQISNLQDSNAAAFGNALNDNNINRICAVFKVPRDMIDASIKVNVSELQKHIENYRNGTVEPFIKLYEQTLQAYFLKYYPELAYNKPLNISHLPYVFKDAKQQLAEDMFFIPMMPPAIQQTYIMKRYNINQDDWDAAIRTGMQDRGEPIEEILEEVPEEDEETEIPEVPIKLKK